MIAISFTSLSLRQGITILSLLLFSGTNNADEVSLEGVWVLDKNKTEQSLRQNDVTLPPVLLQNLGNSYGALAYVFKGNRTTYTQKDTIDDQPNWYSWKVNNYSSASVSIQISGLAEEVEFSREENCIGLLIEDYGYSEYYCLQNL